MIHNDVFLRNPWDGLMTDVGVSIA